MRIRPITTIAFTVAACLGLPVQGAGPSHSNPAVEHGRYLIQVSGCNDCHTSGYAQANGEVPEDQWLTGSAVGFRGPWGTSYPANLRLVAEGLTEDQWIARCRQPMLPPMPWFNLKAMSDRDLAALYRFIHSLGPAGEPAPPAANPGESVATPYIDFVPKNLPAMAKH